MAQRGQANTTPCGTVLASKTNVQLGFGHFNIVDIVSPILLNDFSTDNLLEPGNCGKTATDDEQIGLTYL